jgi:hypothetical protein
MENEVGGTYGSLGGRGAYRVLVGRPEGKYQWEDLGLGGGIRLRWTLERQRSMSRTGFSWLSIGSSDGLV